MNTLNTLSNETLLDELPISLVAHNEQVFIFQTRAFVAVERDFSKVTSYGDLNLGLHVYDDAKQVLDNRITLLSAINDYLLSQNHGDIERLHWVNQVHGSQVHDIDNKLLTMQPSDADAMVSNRDNVALAIMTADCVPIVLYQPATGQIAAIHAGWQGLACGVIKATVARFDKKDLIKAWIGVCISQENYEVGSLVVNKLLAGCTNHQLLKATDLDNFESLYTQSFSVNAEASSDANNNTDNSTDSNTDIDINRNTNIATEYLHKSIDKLSNCATLSSTKNSIAKQSTNKVKLNLPKIARAQLEKLAIEVTNESPSACSYGDSHYYSYRRQTHQQQPATGRMALVIARSQAL